MKVFADCAKEWLNTKKVEFLDIEEGPQGEDRMTYKCPLCGEKHTSVVVNKN